VTNCPNGSYGSGSAFNFDEESGCKECGRGLYSEDDPTTCMDCTPGYVCVGKTSSATPVDLDTQGGYKCPTGFYCPLGSFEPTACPAGSYSKKEGSTNKFKCLPCKLDYYNDLPGQGGCKKCGPTSTTFQGGALTCKCNGANRDFIKSTGSCLCSIGYQPKNNGTNVDSNEDCEQIVKTVCDSDTKVDLTGNCLTADEEAEECKRQCPGSTGSFVEGTGLCQCNSITDVDEVCDSTCQGLMPKTTLQPDGKLKVIDPITNKTSSIDPSLIPGYFGDFKCEKKESSTEECKVRTMGMTEDGSFTYEFAPNDDVLTATNQPSNAQKLTSVIRKENRRKQLGRYLQSDPATETTTPRVKNPAMCVKESDIVFFNVVPEALNYPVYYKDSFLNNNPDFDYGPFLDLERMI